MALKYGKEDIFQGMVKDEEGITVGIGPSGMEFCSGETDRLNTEYSMGSWKFTAKEPGGVCSWKMTKRKFKGKGEF